MRRTAARARVACGTVLALGCAIASSTLSCSRTLLLADDNDGAADAAGDVDDGAPFDRTSGGDDSSGMLEASEDSSAPDVSMLDAEVDSTTTLDAPAETSPAGDAPDDVVDAADGEAEATVEAGCGAAGESCCPPSLTCATGFNCDGTTLHCVCLYEMCGDQCVNEYSDKNNCGACGNACTASEVCSGGGCGCQYNETICSGGACIDTSTDPANCGTCGVSCQSVTGDPSAECVLGGCRTMSVVASSAPYYYYGVAVDDTAVYYSTPSTVEALPKMGGPSIILASGLSAPAEWLLVDSTTIYWASFDSLSGGVYSCPLGGCASAPTELAAIASPVVDMVLDATTVYWATRVDVQACPKTGCGTPASIASNVYPNSLTVDAQFVYWSDTIAIYTCPLSGCTTTPAPLVPSPLGPEALFLDGTNLYWAGGPGVLGCVLPDCAGTQVTIATTGMYAPGLMLGDATNLYWSMAHTDYLARAPRSGGKVTPLAYGSPTAMALDATYLYWVELGGNAIFQDPKVTRSGSRFGLLLGACSMAACAATTDLVAYDEPPNLDSGGGDEATPPDASLDTGDSGSGEAMGDEALEDGPVLDATMAQESGPALVDGSDAADSATPESGDTEVAADATDAAGDGPAIDAADASGQEAGCSFVDGGTGPILPPDGGLLSLPSPELYVGSNVTSATIGDVNSDGRDDLVLCTSSLGQADPSADSSVFVFLQNACGGLSPAVRYPGTRSGHIQTVSIADVTGDGRADIVVDQPNAVGVFPQNAQGTLDPMVVYGLPIDPRFVAVGDLTGDGLLDVFAGMSNMSPTSVGYEMIQSAGVLQSPLPVDSRLGADDLQIADVTGDGRADVVLTSGLSFSIFPQQASGSLGAEIDVPASATVEMVTAMALGDVTGDGRTDLVAAGHRIEDGAIDVYAQTASGALSAPAEYSTAAPAGLGIADFDGDGRNDVVSVNVNIEIRLQTPAGALATPLQFPAPQLSGAPHPLATGDLNSDGRVDIALVTYSGVSIVYGAR